MKLLHGLVILLVVKQLTFLQRGHAGVGDHEGFEIEHPLDVPQGHVQQQADAGGQGFQEPDMSHRAGQFDVAHALAAHLGQGHLDAALLADHAAMLEALVFAALTFEVFHRAEDLGAEQPVPLRLEGAVVDGFRLFHLAEGPGFDHFRRGEADPDGFEILGLGLGAKQA